MSVVDEYLAKLDPAQQKELGRVREIVRQAVPDADEVITYGIPGFKYKGKYLFAYAGFKNHMSVFPGATPVASTKAKLKGYKTSKGTVQFTLDKPLPETVIKEMLATRVQEISSK